MRLATTPKAVLRPFSSLPVRAVALALLLSSPAGAASIRSDGLLAVDGQALFPIGLVELGSSHYPDWEDRIRDSGANIVWDIEIAYADTTPGCAEVMRASRDGGWYLMLGSGDTWNWDNPSTPAYEVNRMMYEPDELAAVLDCMAAEPGRVVSFANRDEPGWTISRGMIGDIDEPHIHGTYQQLRAAVPEAPISMNHAPAQVDGDLETWKSEVRAFGEATDIVMFASYPYPAGPGTCTSWNVLGYPECPMDRLPIAVDLFLGELNRPDQPLWMIVQAHKGIPLKEARWEAWAGIVHGATGVFWAGWTWTHAQGSGEQNWPITRQVISEVSALHPFLTGVAVSDVSSTRPDVEVRAWQPEGSTQVVVVAIARNGYTGPATIQLSQPKQNKATVLYEGRQVNITGGRITDNFSGYEAHVYQYTSRAPGRASTDAPEVAAGAAPFTLATFPNPSSGRTTARFALAQPATVLFRVYDAAGRRVAALGRGNYGAGSGEVVWSGRNDEGRDVAPGVYFVRGTTSRGEEASARVLIRR